MGCFGNAIGILIHAVTLFGRRRGHVTSFCLFFMVLGWGISTVDTNVGGGSLSACPSVDTNRQTVLLDIVVVLSRKRTRL